MKGIITALIITGAFTSSFVLTGCNEKTAKLVPNNWNCRSDISSTLTTRLERQEKEGKINDASLFLEKCKKDKMGFFSDAYKKVMREEHFARNQERIYAQWQKEAGINPNDY